MDINGIRKENLRVMIEQAGGRQAFLAKVGRSDSQISQLLSNSGKARNIGNELARDFERLCGYPEGFMDSRRPLYSVQNPDGSVIYKRTRMGPQTGKKRSQGAVENETDFALISPGAPEREESQMPDFYFEEPGGQTRMIVDAKRYERDPKAAAFRREMEREIEDLLSGISMDAAPLVFLPPYRVEACEASPSGFKVSLSDSYRRPFTASSVPAHSRGHARIGFTLVSDEAMKPLISAGDMVVISPLGDQKIKGGSIYAVQIQAEIKICRLFTKPNGSLRIVSDNPQFPEEQVDRNDLDKITIIGEVIWREGRIR